MLPADRLPGLPGAPSFPSAESVFLAALTRQPCVRVGAIPHAGDTPSRLPRSRGTSRPGAVSAPRGPRARVGDAVAGSASAESPARGVAATPGRATRRPRPEIRRASRSGLAGSGVWLRGAGPGPCCVRLFMRPPPPVFVPHTHARTRMSVCRCARACARARRCETGDMWHILVPTSRALSRAAVFQGGRTCEHVPDF